MIQSIEKFISSSDSLFLCLMIYFYGFVAKNILNPDYKCHRKKVRYQIIIHFTRMDKSKQAKPPNSGINRFYRCLMREFWGTIIGRHKKCCLNFCSVIQNVKNKHAWNFRHVVNKKFQSLKDGLDSYYKNSLFWNNLKTFC